MLVIDYDNIVKLIPPYAKRTAKRIDWLKLNVSSLKDTYTMLDADYVDSMFIAAHNYQVLSLEHFLNTLLEPNDTISILEGTWIEPTFVFIQSEIFADIPEYLYTQAETPHKQVYLFSSAEFVSQQTDFIVNVSTGDIALEPQIKYWVDYFKQAGKKYVINYY